MHVVFFFFFSSRRRHTRFDCDWSSDVCSSDLLQTATATDTINIRRMLTYSDPLFARPSKTFFTTCAQVYAQAHGNDEIGRASCRERSVDLGGRRIIKKKKKKKRV